LGFATNKEVRIRRLGTYLAQRLFRFKRRSPGTALLVQQLQDFPVGDYDDGPDALEMDLRTMIDRWNERVEASQRRVGTLRLFGALLFRRTERFLLPRASRARNCDPPVLAIFRVVCWGFADTMMFVTATVRCSATISGADAT
jgi:hypothetical protein